MKKTISRFTAVNRNVNYPRYAKPINPIPPSARCAPDTIVYPFCLNLTVHISRLDPFPNASSCFGIETGDAVIL